MDRFGNLFVAVMAMLFVSVLFNALFALKVQGMRADFQEMKLDYDRISVRCGVK